MPTSTSALPGTTILNLPITVSMDGDEWVPVVQGGTTKRAQSTTIASISTGGTVPYVMASSGSGFPGARTLTQQSSVTTVVDGGAGGNITIGISSALTLVTVSSQSAANLVGGRYLSGQSSVTTISDGGAGGAVTVGVSSGLTIITVSSQSAANLVGGRYLGAGTGITLLDNGAGNSVDVSLTTPSSVLIPASVAGRVVYYSSANTIAGNTYLNISSAQLTVGLASSLTGTLVLASSAGGVTTIQPSTATATITAPNISTTLIGADTVNTLTGKTFDTAGSSNSFRIGGVVISTATNILDTLGSSGGQILYRSTGTTWSALSVGSSGQILFGGAIPQWATFPAQSSGTVTAVTGGTGIVTTPSTITSSGSVAIDKASSADYFAGTSNKVVTTDIVYQSEVTVAFSSNITFNFATFNSAAVTLSTNISSQTLSNPIPGKAGTIRFIQDATGGRTTVWNTFFKFNGGVAPTLSTAANAVDILNYQIISSTYIPAALMKGVA